MDEDLSARQEELLDRLPAPKAELAESMGISSSTLDGHRERLRHRHNVEIGHRREDGQYVWFVEDRGGGDSADDPDTDDLTGREQYILGQLEQGVSLDDLADDLDERESVVKQHFADIKSQGWDIYHDESAGLYEIENTGDLRSSEHIGTRTRKANKWWETRHNALEREWKKTSLTDVSPAHTPGREDWVTHLTDLHAGDEVRDYAGDVVYRTADIPDVVEYVTRQSIALSDHHGREYDTAHLLWGGDMITNEGIYQGQFEDLDAWLDEQVDTVQDALIEQVRTFSEHFDTVNIVAQVGNHGDMRASGTSKQANADLLLYKAVRTFVAKSQQHWGHLDNVSMTVGNARAYTPVELRGGELHGHLRHGQHRSPQADTSARLKEWLDTLLDTAQSSWGPFDVTWMGHHHVSGRIPWNGPPIFVTGSPKCSGEYVEELGSGGGAEGYSPDDMAHCHGVSDEGVTGIYPIDDRHYS